MQRDNKSNNEEEKKSFSVKNSESIASSVISEENEGNNLETETRDARSESFKYDHLSQFSQSYFRSEINKHLSISEGIKIKPKKDERKWKNESNNY